MKNYSYFRKKYLVSVFSIIVLVLFLNSTSFPKQIKNAFYFISKPTQEWFWKKGLIISDFFEGITQASKIKEDNNWLLSQNTKLIGQNIELEGLKKENKVLRTALGLDLEKSFDLEMAQVIGKDVSSNVITINKGSEAGLRANYPLITENKVLIGKIVEIYSNVSKVQLLSSQDSLLNIKVFNKNIFGLLRGGNSSNYSFDLIPKESEVLPGDLVVTSGFGGDFPKGLLVGTIDNVKNSKTVSFKEATVKPSFNIQNLNNVFIILNSNF